MKRIWSAFFLFFLSVSLFADTLGDAVRSLFTQRRYNEVPVVSQEQALSDYAQAKASFYPSLSLSAPFSWSDTVINRTESGAQTVDIKDSVSLDPSVSLSLSQLLPTAGILSASIAGGYSYSDIGSVSPSYFSSVYSLDPVSTANFSLSLSLSQPVFTKPFYSVLQENLTYKEKAVRRSVLEEKNNILRAFVADCFSVWSHFYNVDVLHTRYESSVARSERFKKEKELGLWTDRQVLSAEIEARRAKLALDNAEASLERLEAAFKARYGIDVPKFSDMPVWAAPDVSFDDVLVGNIELAKLKASANEAKIARLSVEKDISPSVSASVSASINNTLDDVPYSFSLSGSASIYVTVFDAGASKARVDSAGVAEKRALMAVDDYVLTLRTRYEELVYKLNSYDSQRKVDEDMLRAAEMELDAAERELEKGHSTVSAVREKALAVDTARMDMWSNLVEYNLAVLDLYMLAGKDLEELFKTGVFVAED
ncbi:TolC family protein [Spirochaetia bacterium 38H-sp]|uniref:TolC family protein n=1 Tax=Rarispira pelagica TaxID=3141764 RepID=A0ABU9UCA2_9SPIR